MSGTISWSYTIGNTFSQCQRKYFLAAVAANHKSKLPVRRLANNLKGMQNLTMWQGTVVDKFMEKVIIPKIANRERLDFEQLAEDAVRMAEIQFRFSKNQAYRDRTQNKSDLDGEYCILDIHEIGQEYTEEEISKCYAAIRQAILHIPTMRMPDNILLVDYLLSCSKLVPNVSNWLVYIEKARVKPQIDLVAYDQNWKPIIIDWKLSDSLTSDYSRQLIIAGVIIYLKRKIDYPEKPAFKHEEIKLYEVNLLKGLVKEHEFTVDDCNDMIDHINLSSAGMAMIAGKKYEESNIDDFELTENEGACQSCNFRTLCNYLLNNATYDEEAYFKFIQDQQFA